MDNPQGRNQGSVDCRLRVNGERHIETFQRKKDADAREAQVTVNVGKGIHIAPNKTPTVKEAGNLWIEACEAAELHRSSTEAYEQHYACTSSRLWARTARSIDHPIDPRVRGQSSRRQGALTARSVRRR